jgi:hypothetical protein
MEIDDGGRSPSMASASAVCGAAARAREKGVYGGYGSECTRLRLASKGQGRERSKEGEPGRELCCMPAMAVVNRRARRVGRGTTAAGGALVWWILQPIAPHMLGARVAAHHA